MKGLVKKPGYLLGLVLVLYAVVFTIDVIKPADKQLSVSLVTQLISAYQQNISPKLQGKIKCAYQLPCSHYTILSLQKHGFIKGLYLSLNRIAHCRQNVGPLENWEKP